MISTERVEDTASRNESLSEISEDVDVETVLAGEKSFYGTIDGCGGFLLGLRGEQEKELQNRAGKRSVCVCVCVRCVFFVCAFF